MPEPGAIYCGDSIRDERGRFRKGRHWRNRQPFWEKSWLETEYIEKQRSSAEIAAEFGLRDTAIQYWLHKHGIPTRTVGEARAIKHWGVAGPDNPMYGRTGSANPNWNGGCSHERQSVYARAMWKALAKKIMARDDYRCQKCAAKHDQQHKLQVHHIKPWSKHPELRFEEENLLTLCQTCHKAEHSRR